MKIFNNLLVFLLVTTVVNAQDSQHDSNAKKLSSEGLVSYGAEITSDAAANASQMADKYEALKVSDTVQVKFTATVKEVCQSSGCWMVLRLDNDQETMVRFKDYAIFMPKDIAGREVIVNGLAFVEEMSVKDQRHFAKDAGKSDDEIAKITSTKKTYSLEADGVLLKE